MTGRDTEKGSIINSLRGPALWSAGFALLCSLVGRNATRTQGGLEWLGVHASTFGLLWAGGFTMAAAAEALDREWRRRSK